MNGTVNYGKVVGSLYSLQSILTSFSQNSDPVECVRFGFDRRVRTFFYVQQSCEFIFGAVLDLCEDHIFMSLLIQAVFLYDCADCQRAFYVMVECDALFPSGSVICDASLVVRYNVNEVLWWNEAKLEL